MASLCTARRAITRGGGQKGCRGLGDQTKCTLITIFLSFFSFLLFFLFWRACRFVEGGGV